MELFRKIAVFIGFGFSKEKLEGQILPPTVEEPKFLLPETAEEYRLCLEEAKAVFEEKILETIKYNKKIEAQAIELQEREVNPAQKEINRRTAKILHDQKRLWRIWNEEDQKKVLNEVRKTEVRKILTSGKILSHTTETELICWGYSPANCKEITWNRTLVLFQDRFFLIREEGEEVQVITKLSGLNEKELKALSEVQSPKD